MPSAVDEVLSGVLRRGSSVASAVSGNLSSSTGTPGLHYGLNGTSAAWCLRVHRARIRNAQSFMYGRMFEGWSGEQ